MKLIALALVLSSCTLNRPSTGDPGRTAPAMSTVTATPRDTLFARAFAAMRQRGYTEISPDAPAAQVRGKSSRGTSVTVAFAAAAGDSTRVTVSAAGDRRSIGIDAEALSTVMTLMADVTRPPGATASDSTARADSTTPGPATTSNAKAPLAERSATILPGQPQPAYPASLRGSGVKGRVVVQFVVDATGAPELGTFKVVESPHPDLTLAVREIVPMLRFAPARIGEKPVRQLVVMPFTFDPR
ncbi:MAG TPA: TonB family protein [Gemmatimonadaceae bacterium]|nr:TonB family protein [Gemmatimonadaceae bacterium]